MKIDGIIENLVDIRDGELDGSSSANVITEAIVFLQDQDDLIKYWSNKWINVVISNLNDFICDNRPEVVRELMESDEMQRLRSLLFEQKG